MWLGHHAQVDLDHCLLDGRIGIGIMHPIANQAVFKRSHLKIKHCTLRTEDAICVMLHRRPEEVVEVEIQNSIFDSEHTVSLISVSNFMREQFESQPENSLKSCIQWQETRCVHDSKCEHLVTRRILNIERYASTGVSSLAQWLSLVSNHQRSDETHSVSAKLIRLPDDPNDQTWPTYQFESTSTTQLPHWVDQVGPTAASPSKP